MRPLLISSRRPGTWRARTVKAGHGRPISAGPSARPITRCFTAWRLAAPMRSLVAPAPRPQPESIGVESGLSSIGTRDHAERRCERQCRIKEFPSEIRNFAQQFAHLQIKRHKADYDPDVRFSENEVIQVILEAENVIRRFTMAPLKDRRAFAVYVPSCPSGRGVADPDTQAHGRIQRPRPVVQRDGWRRARHPATPRRQPSADQDGSCVRTRSPT